MLLSGRFEDAFSRGVSLLLLATCPEDDRRDVEPAEASLALM
jgi:hypothetical protein